MGKEGQGIKWNDEQGFKVGLINIDIDKILLWCYGVMVWW